MTLDSPTALRGSLFFVLLWTWPIPLFGLDGSMVPIARFVQLAASLTVLMAIEGTGGVVGALFLLLWGHVLVYGVLLFLVASLFVRHVLSRLPDRLGFWVSTATVVALVLWGTFGSPYDSTFHHSDAHASLMNLYR